MIYSSLISTSLWFSLYFEAINLEYNATPRHEDTKTLSDILTEYNIYVLLC